MLKLWFPLKRMVYLAGFATAFCVLPETLTLLSVGGEKQLEINLSQISHNFGEGGSGSRFLLARYLLH